MKTFAFILVLCFCSMVHSWGPDGHQIVAEVANSYLTSTTQNQISNMLGSNTLPGIATWPDNYDHSSGGEWSEQDHFVNVPVTALKFNYSDCTPPNANGCVVTAINNYTSILQNDLKNGVYEKCTNEDAVPCPLSFLTHYLGDVHQPLHVGYEVDRGGNYFDCEYDNDCTNLHSVWDSRLIYTYEDDNDMQWYNVAEQIANFLSTDNEAIRIISNTTDPAAWASESFAVVRVTPYNLSPGTVPPASNWIKNFYHYIDQSKTNYKGESTFTCSGPNLPYQYYERTIPVIFNQLAKGGLRLAYRLNSIYDPNFHGSLTFNGYQY